MIRKCFIISVAVLALVKWSSAQDVATLKAPSNAGYFSLGGRSTVSLFDSDGAGLGTGGQFRIQFSERVNSDWFADYISINVDDRVRSEYYHIGWSILYYPSAQLKYPRLLQPYILAGHCFDYNRKSDMANSANSLSRWGSAVQAGVGTHFNLTDRFDLSLTCQYMIHLTTEIDSDITDQKVSFNRATGSAFEGHLLTTMSFNYKLFKLWKSRV